MLRWISALLASATLVACGLVHGFWTDRWQPPVETARAAERLDTLPLELGDWRGQPLEMKSGQAGGGVAGCIQRSYEHRATGARVTLYLVCGRHGPVSIHNPEVCYGASGYTVGGKNRVPMKAGGSLWRTDAIRATPTEEKKLRLYWGWNGGAGWTAPDDARRQFAHFPVLHKLYVLREVSSLGEPTRAEPCEDFLHVLLPALEKALFAPGS